MIFALGFLVAGLVALAAAPAFWRRAIRLSTRRLEQQLPLSLEEILAGRDLLRAEFAVEQRRLEQKAEALNLLRAADMAGLGRQAAAIARLEADRAALAKQNSEHKEELAAARRAFAELSAELAATAKECYDESGLLARKDAQIGELKAKLEDAHALAAEQQTALAALRADALRQAGLLAAQTAKAEQLEGELAALRLQRQAGLVTLKTTAAKAASREQALEAALKREKELIRHRSLQAESARAAETGYLEKIERLRSAHAATKEALDAARTTCEKQMQELAALRMALPLQEAAAHLQREENEILRLKISEIGAAVIGAAGGAAGAAPAPRAEAGGVPERAIAEKATA